MKKSLLIFTIITVIQTGCQSKPTSQQPPRLREVTREELNEQQELLDEMPRSHEFDIE